MQRRIAKVKSARSGTSPARRRARGKIMQPLPTIEEVEQRARELAAIAGRDANRPTESDRRRAKRELREPIHPMARTSDQAQLETEPWNPAPASIGRRAPRRLPRDDQTEKETVEEGVDEAEHDQMVEAAKSRTRNTG